MGSIRLSEVKTEAMIPFFKSFGLDFVDKLLDADGARLSAEVDGAYLRGFLDSFRLWMEVLSARP